MDDGDDFDPADWSRRYHFPQKRPLDDAQLARLAAIAEVREARDRRNLKAQIARRGLASFMNATRWRALQKAVLTEMPFPPIFQLQSVIGPRVDPLPPGVMGGWGGWADDLADFAFIEWIQVRPLVSHTRGALIAPRIEDGSDPFREILQRLNIPFVERDGDFWIYGYADRAPC